MIETSVGYAIRGNRWDLLQDRVAPRLTVSVVVPYYDQQRQLDMLLSALENQTMPVLEVIVADDGSPVPPVVDSTLTVVIVRQEDNGFRAAAARNLGARAASGKVLCFLDADTIPEPGYVEALVRLPSLVPDAVTVGRRRHADLEALGRLPGPDDEVLDEPAWLLDAYRGSRNLLDADHRSYRHVISAVMCCTTAFFDEIGGFDESFTRYGGEDWELANRAYLAGAVLAHVPEAIAWHDGPDWAARPSEQRSEHKNAEAMSLSRLITDPAARTHSVRYAVPDLTVVVRTDGHTAASLLVTVGSVLAHGDVAVWVDGDLADEWGHDDPRIRRGKPTDNDVRRSRYGLELSGRVVLGSDSVRLLQDATTEAGMAQCAWPDATLTWWSWRAVRRARRWASVLGKSETETLTDLFGIIALEPDDVDATVGPAVPDLSW